jgi:cell division septation protein DedD
MSKASRFLALTLVSAGVSTASPAIGQELRFESQPLKLDPQSREEGEPLPIIEAVEISERPTFNGRAGTPFAPKERAPRMLEAPKAAEETTKGLLLHLASYHKADDAAAGWSILRARHRGQLRDFEPVLRDVDLGDKGIFVRLLAGPVKTKGEARALCPALRDEGAYCMPADQAGSFLPQNWD